MEGEGTGIETANVSNLNFTNNQQNMTANIPQDDSVGSTLNRNKE